MMKTIQKKSKKTATIHARIDSKLKDEGVYVLEQLGLSVSEFITMSFGQMARDKAVQFELRLLSDDRPEKYTKVKNINHLEKLIGFQNA